MPLNQESKKALEDVISAAMFARDAEDEESYQRAATQLFDAYQTFKHCQTWEDA